MTTADIIREIENLGVRMWSDEGTLRYRAPQGVLTESLRQRLLAHKEGILAHLAAAASGIEPDLAGRYDPFPLTEVQSAYLIGRRPGLAYGGVGCHAYGEIGLTPIDPERMSAAWQRLIDRHDMLRARISDDGSQQIFRETPAYRPSVYDLRSSGEDATGRARATIRAEMDHRVYQAGEWPLFDIRISLADQGDRLHISIDFLIADYLSIFTLLEELRLFYETPQATLPPPRISFRDCQLENQRQRTGRLYDRDRDYWLTRVKSLPLAPELPIEERPVDPPRFKRWEARMLPAQWAQLAGRGKARGLTPSATVLAAFAEVIGRWSSQQHFLIDLTVMNRPRIHEDIDRIVGDFTTVILLEVDHRSAIDFGQRAKQLQERLANDLEHHRFSGIEVIRELMRLHGPRASLCPIVFTSAIGLSGGESAVYPLRELPLGELAGAISQTPQVWIDCQVMERGGHLTLNWDVREGVFSPALVDSMFNAFTGLLNRLSVDENGWESKCPVPLVPDQQVRRLRLNSTGAALPPGTPLTAALDHARVAGNAPCIFSPHANISYSELFNMAGAVKDGLLSRGVRPGDYVGVLVAAGPWQVAAVLGVLLAGSAYVPMESHDPAERRRKFAASAELRVVVTDCSDHDVGDHLSTVLCPLAPTKEIPDEIQVSPDLPAYAIFTSGSTGEPKGVVISRRSAWNTITDLTHRFQLCASDRVFCLSKLSFDLSVFDIFALLGAGGSLIIPTPERRGDPSHWVQLMTEHGATIWNSVPALAGSLVDYLSRNTAGGLPPIRLGLLSGDWVSVELAQRVQRTWPACAWIALGGATEASIWSIYFPLSELATGSDFVPYGRPLANQTMFVLDEALRVCPDGTVGEIYVGGVGVATGYLKDDEKTRASFPQGRFGEGRLYRTGDIGRYIASGDVQILGRKDSRVKIRGHRIELGEIETALSRCEDIRQAVCVVANEGSNRARIHAFVEAAFRSPSTNLGRLWLAENVSAEILGTENIHAYLAYTNALDQVALAAILACLRSGGIFSEKRPYSEAEIIEKLQPLPQYNRLICRWLQAAGQHGVLTKEAAGGGWTVAASGLVDNVDEAWAAIGQMGQGFDSPDVLEYFRASCAALPDLIRGRSSPLNLLYPQGRYDVAASLQEHSFVNRWANAVAGAAAKQLAGLAVDHQLRVVELGAGVGSTTAAMLDTLPKSAEYWFTEVTPYFLNIARGRFANDPRVRVHRLDANADYRSQGLEPNSFDLVVAGDVLHALADVPSTLEFVREILRPGGWLIAIEMTRDHCQIMTSLELLNHVDSGRPAKDGGTFFSREQWLAMLTDARAGDVAALPDPGDDFARAGLCVFASQFKTDRAGLDSKYLEETLTVQLPTYMVPSEIHVLDQLPVSENGKVDRKLLRQWATQEPSQLGAVAMFSSELEQRVAGIWAQVLGLPSVDLDQDFFAAGGDSLLAAQLAGRILEEIPEATWIFFDDLLRRILEGPTVRSLASGFEDSAESGERSLDPAPAPAILRMGGDPASPGCIVVGSLEGLTEHASVLTEHYQLLRIPVAPALPIPVERMAADFRQEISGMGLRRGYLIALSDGVELGLQLAVMLLESGVHLEEVILVLSEQLSPIGLQGHLAANLCIIRGAGIPFDEERWRKFGLFDLRIFEAKVSQVPRVSEIFPLCGL